MKSKESHIVSNVDNCRIFNLDCHPDINGKLAVVENGEKFPFEMKRMFFLYDVPSGAARGGHSHYEEEQFLIAVSGSFDVILHDGVEQKRVTLNRPNIGLHIPPGIWRELENFTSGAVCVALASTNFEENDYVRDFNEFLELTKAK